MTELKQELDRVLTLTKAVLGYEGRCWYLDFDIMTATLESLEASRMTESELEAYLLRTSDKATAGLIDLVGIKVYLKKMTPYQQTNARFLHESVVLTQLKVAADVYFNLLYGDDAE